MKTFKSSKLLALILAIALCLGAVCTTAFASEEPSASAEAAQPKIISQNVKYGGNFSLLFAVEAATCSGSTVALKVYDEEPTATSKPIWVGTQTSSDELVEVNGTLSYVFTTPGVAAKDMDQNYYVVAESAGIKSEVKKYSVAEYLYERLYGDGVYSAPDAIGKAQADLYKSVLQMGKDAQDLLFNHDDDPNNDRTTFVTDLYYVAVAADVQGTHGLLNDKSAGILTDGSASIRLRSATDTAYHVLTWNVKYIDAAGNITVERDVKLSSIAPTSHMIITPCQRAAAPSAYTMDSVSTINASYIKPNPNAPNTVVTLGEYNGSKAAVITITHNGSYYEFYNGVTTAETGATKLIYDTDITFPVPDEGNMADGYARYRFQLTGRSINGSSYKATTLYVDVFEDGTQRVSDTKNGLKKVASGTLNIRVEYYASVIGGVEKMVADYYINGEFYGSVVTDYAYTPEGATANGVNDISWMSIVPPTALNTTTPIYQDNLTMAKIAPVANLVDTMDDPGAHAIDGWTTDTVPSSFISDSNGYVTVVDHEGSSALKFDMSSASTTESITMFTQHVEDDADTFIFEADITNLHPSAMTFKFYGADGHEVYDFFLNGQGGGISEGNQIWWGKIYTQGVKNTIRFVFKITDDKLDFNVYVNGILVARPSTYGTGKTFTQSGKIDLAANAIPMDTISKVVISDGSAGSTFTDGYMIFDNIKMAAIKTTK